MAVTHRCPGPELGHTITRYDDDQISGSSLLDWHLRGAQGDLGYHPTNKLLVSTTRRQGKCRARACRLLAVERIGIHTI